MNIKSWGKYDFLNHGIFFRSAILRQTREKSEYRQNTHILAEWCNSSTGNKGCFWSFSQKKIYWRLWWTLATAAFLCTVLTAPATFSRVCMFCKTVMSWTYVPKMLWFESVQNAGKKQQAPLALGFSRYKKNAGIHLPHLDRFTSTNINYPLVNIQKTMENHHF